MEFCGTVGHNPGTKVSKGQNRFSRLTLFKIAVDSHGKNYNRDYSFL